MLHIAILGRNGIEISSIMASFGILLFHHPNLKFIVNLGQRLSGLREDAGKSNLQENACRKQLRW